MESKSSEPQESILASPMRISQALSWLADGYEGVGLLY